MWLDAQGADLLEPLQGLDQARHADPGRGAAESLQGCLPGTLVGDQQGLQAGRLPRLQGPCQGAPQPRGRPVADLGHQAGQHGDPRQQDLALDQPGRGQVEEHAGAFGAEPGPVGEPAGQGRGLGPLVEVAVAVVAADLGGVVPARLARGVAPQARRCRRCPVAGRGRPRRPAGPRWGRPGRCPGTAPSRVARRSRGGCGRPGAGRSGRGPRRRGGSSVRAGRARARPRSGRSVAAAPRSGSRRASQALPDNHPFASVPGAK